MNDSDEPKVPNTKEEVAEYLERERGSIGNRIWPKMQYRCQDARNGNTRCAKEATGEVIDRVSELAESPDWDKTRPYREKFIHYSVSFHIKYRPRDIIRRCKGCQFNHVSCDDENAAPMLDAEISLRTEDEIGAQLELFEAIELIKEESLSSEEQYLWDIYKANDWDVEQTAKYTSRSERTVRRMLVKVRAELTKYGYAPLRVKKPRAAKKDDKGHEFGGYYESI